MLLGKLLPPIPWKTALSLTLLTVEIIGLVLLAVAAAPSLSDMKFGFAQQRREFAELLDFSLPHHHGLIEWLRCFPRDRLKDMCDYAAFRSMRFQSKLPVMIGGMGNLAMLPVLAAIVVQFKDMRWPPDPSWWQVLLFLVLMLFYWLSMVAVSLRLRLELYESLLKEALAQDTACKTLRPET